MRRVILDNVRVAIVFNVLWIVTALICLVASVDDETLDGFGLTFVAASIGLLFLINTGLTWARYDDTDWSVRDIALRSILTIATPIIALSIVVGCGLFLNFLLKLIERWR